MRKLSDYFKGESLDFLKEVELQNVRLYKKDASVELECISQKMLMEGERLQIKRLFAESLGIDSKNIKLIVHCTQKISYSSENMQQYIQLIQRQWREEGLGLCALAFQNLKEENGELVVTTSSSMDLRLLNERNADMLISRWFQENCDVEMNVTLRLDKEGQKELIAEHQKKREEEVLRQHRLREAENRARESAVSPKSIKNENFQEKPAFGKPFTGEAVSMESLEEGMGLVIVEGTIFSTDSRLTKTGKTIVTFEFTDDTYAIRAKLFADEKTVESVMTVVGKGKAVRARGEYTYDSFSKEMVFNVRALYAAAIKKRMDCAPEKRCELHAHTVMSSYDGIIEPEELVARAIEWGHRAIAITDHGVLQGNPNAFGAMEAALRKVKDKKKKAENPEDVPDLDFNVIFGCEGYLYDDVEGVIQGVRGSLNREYVAFDLETTGLSLKEDAITEIGAVRIRNGEVVERFDQFVDPERYIPFEVTQLTGITNDMVAGQPKVDKAIEKLKEFAGDDILIAHNASFDMGFIHKFARKHGIRFENKYIDTLLICRALFPELKKHKLDIIAKHLNIMQIAHHRADDDALVCGRIWERCVEIFNERGISDFEGLNQFVGKEHSKLLPTRHVVVLAKNKKGMIAMNKLVSRAHLEFYYKRPRMPKSVLAEMREELMIGSACDAGELYEAMLTGADESTLDSIGNFYDYFEIQPLGNTRHIVESGQVEDDEALKEINKGIVRLAKKLGKPFVATGDVHFMEPKDSIYRAILMHSKGFEDADNQAPLYFRTTDEMMAEFDYLGAEDCYKAVITNPNLVASAAERYQLMPDSLVAPVLPGAKEEITETAWKRAHEIYGETLPEIVEARINKELNAIIGNGYQVLYLTAKKLVEKSNADGYPVGSRGSVGASYVAYLTGITEVNALEAHYLCDQCKHVDFDVPLHACAFDIEDRMCPNCDIPMSKHGLDMPFEVFLGFKGDKVPDIDLNFSGDYQTKIHRYTETLFGKENVFKAGTIGTLQAKTVAPMVKDYLAEHGREVSHAEVNRLIEGCVGVKRTTGQHPGGMVVCPEDREIYEFTALQHPADKESSEVITTHYDFNFIHDTLVKLDLLGHDGPTLLKMLCDLSGVKLKDIPESDKKTMSLFSSVDALNLKSGELFMDVGTLGIPEYNTPFLRGILMKIRPKTFAELISINGLSHGEGIWIGNGLDLVENNIVPFEDVVATRENVMFKLINWGMDNKTSFDVMESVRKGRGIKPEWIEEMHKKNVPQWFIDSCLKIKYLFPKPHAAAYAQTSYRIAYFKVYYPLQFYATYFSIKASDFDGDLAVLGADAIKKRFLDVKSAGKTATAKDQDMQPHLETAYEMYCRGYRFYPVDIELSHATNYVIENDGIRIPFSGLQGVGAVAAESIYQARLEAPFTSVDDLRKRSKVSKSVIEALKNHGALTKLPETAQIEFM